MKRGDYYQYGDLKVKRGNLKVGRDTLIINMGPATNCPARYLCKVREDCYALRDEKFYGPGVLKYRQQQQRFWKSSNTVKIRWHFNKLFALHPELRAEIKYLRFNESGDFWSQDCIDKLNVIAAHLRDTFGIITYGYTARADLIEHLRICSFLVKGSGYDIGNNGMTIVIDNISELPEGFEICPGKCAECDLCKVDNKINIAFFNHVKPVRKSDRIQYRLF